MTLKLSEEGEAYSLNDAKASGFQYGGKLKLDSCLILCTKMYTRWVEDVNMISNFIILEDIPIRLAIVPKSKNKISVGED